MCQRCGALVRVHVRWHLSLTLDMISIDIINIYIEYMNIYIYITYVNVYISILCVNIRFCMSLSLSLSIYIYRCFFYLH